MCSNPDFTSVDIIGSEYAPTHYGAPLPDDEPERLKYLQSLNILDTGAQDCFDDITAMLAKVFDVPIVLVSLVDRDRQWFKSNHGLSALETPREQSFCAHLLSTQTPEVLLVSDAALDPRFRNNPLVLGEPHIRFYCGAPIILGGHRLGSLCLIDRAPKTLSKDDAMLLVNFANIVAGHIEKDHSQAKEHDMVDNPSFLVNCHEDGWPVIYLNDHAKDLLNTSGRSAPLFMDHFTLSTMDGVMERGGTSTLTETRVVRGAFGTKHYCSCFLYPASRQVAGQGAQTTVSYPYQEVSGAAAEASLPNAIMPSAKAKGQHCFIVVKFSEDRKAGVAAASSSAEVAETKKPSQLWFAAPPQMSLLVMPRDLEDAIKNPLCVVMLSSRYCGTCTRFAEFYSMMCNSVNRVRFYVVSIDDSIDLAEVCCTGAIFVPTVNFYSCGDKVEQLAGGSCAHFRQRLKSFQLHYGHAAQAAPEISGAQAAPAPPPAEQAPAKDLVPVVPGELAKGGATPVTRFSFAAGTSRIWRCMKPWGPSRGSQATSSAKAAGYVGDGAAAPSGRPKQAGAAQGSGHGGPNPHVDALAMQLQAEHAYSQRLQKLISRTSAAECDGVGGCAYIPKSCARKGPMASATAEARAGAKAGDPYRFAGSVLDCLSPILTHSLVLIYGESRADLLEHDMHTMGINAKRQAAVKPDQGQVSLQGHAGMPLAVLDVNDIWSPRELQSSFLEVIRTLSTIDVYVVVSSTNQFFDVLALLGGQVGWTCNCTKGTETEVWMLVFQKIPNYDAAVRAQARPAAASAATEAGPASQDPPTMTCKACEYMFANPTFS